MTLQTLRDQVARRITDRRVILVGADLDQFSQHLHELRSLGARNVLVVAGGTGSGPVPDLDGYDVEFVSIESHSGDVHSERGWRRTLEDPSTELQRAVNAFDPFGDAVVIPWRFRAGTRFGDRPFYGPRLPSAVKLEDKTRIGSFLRQLGVPQPAGGVTVSACEPSLRLEAARVDRGAGTVWAGDATSGTNSGSRFVRRVQCERDADSAAAFFTSHCEKVRISPFVEGIPFGMHAFVHRRGVAVFRPVELLILRSPLGSGFVDCGFATTFDPDPDDVMHYEALVRRIGSALHSNFGYEGAISVDAILSDEGWVVHEVNPRQGGGLVYMQDALPALPIHLLHHVAAAGDLQLSDPSALGAMVQSAAYRTRTVAARYAVDWGPLEPRIVSVEVVSGEVMQMHYRPRLPQGGRIDLAVPVRPGSPAGPLVARAASIANARLGLGPALEAPRRVRTRDSGSRWSIATSDSVARAAH